MWKNDARRRTYQSYADMLQRCYNPHNHNYKNYGARGITVCKRWREKFENFLEDMGLKPDGLTIERADNNGNYEASNCRWATRAEQRRNQRDCVHLEFGGLRMTVDEWARHLGLHPETVRSRVRARFPIDKILTTRKFGPTRRCAMSAKERL